MATISASAPLLPANGDGVIKVTDLALLYMDTKIKFEKLQTKDMKLTGLMVQVRR